MDFDKVYYIHFRAVHMGTYDLSAKGGVTVAVAVKDNVWMVNGAVCSLKDFYEKSKGRRISLGRLMKEAEHGTAMTLFERPSMELMHNMAYGMWNSTKNGRKHFFLTTVKAMNERNIAEI